MRSCSRTCAKGERYLTSFEAPVEVPAGLVVDFEVEETSRETGKEVLEVHEEVLGNLKEIRSTEVFLPSFLIWRLS